MPHSPSTPATAVTTPYPPSGTPQRHLLTIGLTGGIGSGKSLVADLFVQHGAALVDTDAIAHQLTGPGGAAIGAIRQVFGDGVIAPDGRMDRAAMRARVFADPAERKRLEGILHPLIQQEAQRRLAALAGASLQTASPQTTGRQTADTAGAGMILGTAPAGKQSTTGLERADIHTTTAEERPAPLTHRPPYVLVAVPLLVESGHWQQRVDRVLVVDCPENVQVARVMARSGLAAAQVRAIMASQASRERRLSVADDVIDNGGSIEATTAQVAALHRQYLARGAST